MKSIVRIKSGKLDKTEKEIDLKKFKVEQMDTGRRRDSDGRKWKELIQDTKEKANIDNLMFNNDNLR